MVLVLPLPAPAKIKSGPSMCIAASLCSLFKISNSFIFRYPCYPHIAMSNHSVLSRLYQSHQVMPHSSTLHFTPRTCHLRIRRAKSCCACDCPPLTPHTVPQFGLFSIIFAVLQPSTLDQYIIKFCSKLYRKFTDGERIRSTTPRNISASKIHQSNLRSVQ